MGKMHPLQSELKSEGHSRLFLFTNPSKYTFIFKQVHKCLEDKDLQAHLMKTARCVSAVNLSVHWIFSIQNLLNMWHVRMFL